MSIPPFRFVAIEGNSGVGKSTTGKALARLLGLRRQVSEYNAYMGRVGGRPPAFPPTSKVAVAASNWIWPKIDLLRHEELRERSVLDTTPLSVFAFELAKAAEGIPHDIQDLASRYVELYDSGRLIEPIGWIFLFSPPIVVLERIKARGGSRSFLKNKNILEYLDRLRHHFLTSYLSWGNALRIDNSSKSPEEVVRIAYDFALPLLLSGQSSPPALRTFLAEMLSVPDRINELADL